MPILLLFFKVIAQHSFQMPYNKEPAVVDRNQCLWPLVQSIDTYRDAMPVIDDCYMPCRYVKFVVDILFIYHYFCSFFLWGCLLTQYLLVELVVFAVLHIFPFFLSQLHPFRYSQFLAFYCCGYLATLRAFGYIWMEGNWSYFTGYFFAPLKDWLLGRIADRLLFFGERRDMNCDGCWLGSCRSGAYQPVNKLQVRHTSGRLC